MKTLLVSSIAVLLLSTAAASAASQSQDGFVVRAQPIFAMRQTVQTSRLAYQLNGFGYYGNGSTATGGPSGGLPDRN